MGVFAHIAAFFTFSALILQIFTLLGNTYNKPFLNSLYFSRIDLSTGFDTFGLWSYCNGTKDIVNSCSQPVPAFDWSQADDVKYIIGDMHSVEQLFLANFVLYWIAFGLTLLALIFTSLSHFKRGPYFCAALSTFLSFFIMLFVFVFVLVLSMRGINTAKGTNPDITGSLGPATWMTVGAFAALLMSTICYCFVCVLGPDRVRSEYKY
ncbi:actin cortical patch SUR7/pH-response regulator pali [Sporodiniella umbellata]|nr:actin cortical patch SUR7/pH-response regulator pali [Sporodiniella umbellata]